MTKVTHNLGFKVLALFLVVISAVSGLLGLTAVILSGEYGFYSQKPMSYYETFWCEAVTWDYVSEVYSQYEHTSDEWRQIENLENSNFGFEIHDEDGITLVQQNVAEDIGHSKSYRFGLSGEYDVDGNWIPYDKPKTIEIIGYVKTPLTASDNYTLTFQLYEMMYAFRTWTPVLIAVSLIVFFASFIYLLCAAGHKGKNDVITPNLQDRIPLDLYLVFVVLLGAIPIQVIEDIYAKYNFTYFVVLLGVLFYYVALAMGIIMSIATRLKMGKWWQNSIVYGCLYITWQAGATMISSVRDMVDALPLTWKMGGAWLFVSTFYFVNSGNSFSVFMVNGMIMLLLLSVLSQLQRLKQGGEKLASGNLEEKIDVSRMFRIFRSHGNNLNSLSKGALIAIEQKMKSERLKTELITNVSHDIKTPLTSIINYVDLLKKEELKGQAEEYLDVLDRQSKRLKKLTEDLLEASKVSTGNIATNLVETDLCELVNQGVAEYEERIEQSNLEVVINVFEDQVFALIDGNLTWRILSNLLSNGCKYSQPNTRIYIEILKKGEYASITMKNISRQQLNIAPDELMERFVRGDAARSTEGSGLGLNIAKSLTEIQHGKFDISIDGDMFKAFLEFPLAKEIGLQEEHIDTSQEKV